MSEITVAVVQMAPVLMEQEQNVGRIREKIREIASREPTDLIVFPELVTTGRECGARFPRLAERLDGSVVSLIAESAAQMNVAVAFGMVLKEKVESVIYNAMVLVGPDGEFVGDYRKVHLRGEERMAFREGHKFPVFEMPFGSVGMLIGWDVMFPEAARSLVLDGASLIVLGANWESSMASAWRPLLTARAIENGVFVAAANRVGEEPSYSFPGDSMILGPAGETYSVVDEPVEGYAVARLDLARVRVIREELQILQNRHPDSYRKVVRKY